MSDKVVTVAIVGNPNCGKTSLFNALTGARQKVGNWPGVTVDRKEGTFQYDGRQVRVIDLPGVYSLAVAGASSIDERIARDYILSQAADVIVNILDASNLERNFYLTTQLLEMGVPMILALNMMDAARSKGLVIDTQSFQDRLGLPVRGVVAPTGEGLDLLKAAMAASAVRQYKPKLSVEFGTALEAENAIENHAVDTICNRTAGNTTPRDCALNEIMREGKPAICDQDIGIFFRRITDSRLRRNDGLFDRIVKFLRYAGIILEKLDRGPTCISGV